MGSCGIDQKFLQFCRGKTNTTSTSGDVSYNIHLFLIFPIPNSNSTRSGSFRSGRCASRDDGAATSEVCACVYVIKHFRAQLRRIRQIFDRSTGSLDRLLDRWTDFHTDRSIVGSSDRIFRPIDRSIVGSMDHTDRSIWTIFMERHSGQYSVHYYRCAGTPIELRVVHRTSIRGT